MTVYFSGVVVSIMRSCKQLIQNIISTSLKQKKLWEFSDREITMLFEDVTLLSPNMGMIFVKLMHQWYGLLSQNLSPHCSTEVLQSKIYLLVKAFYLLKD